MNELQRLYSRLFAFYSLEDDAKWFRWKIYQELQNNTDKPLPRLCRDLIHERCGFSKNSMYLRYNAKNNKLYIDRSFMRWVKLTRDETLKELEEKVA